jgi:hypothetical protein
VIVTVEVTQADIDHGEPGEPCVCPVARAIARVVAAEDWAPLVTATSVQFDADCADLPREARDFIGRFDSGQSVEPFSFQFDVPDDLIPAKEA